MIYFSCRFLGHLLLQKSDVWCLSIFLPIFTISKTFRNLDIKPAVIVAADAPPPKSLPQPWRGHWKIGRGVCSEGAKALRGDFLQSHWMRSSNVHDITSRKKTSKLPRESKPSPLRPFTAGRCPRRRRSSGRSRSVRMCHCSTSPSATTRRVAPPSAPSPPPAQTPGATFRGNRCHCCCWCLKN